MLFLFEAFISGAPGIEEFWLRDKGYEKRFATKRSSTI